LTHTGQRGGDKKDRGLKGGSAAKASNSFGTLWGERNRKKKKGEKEVGTANGGKNIVGRFSRGGGKKGK